MTDCWKCVVTGVEIDKTNAPPDYYRPSAPEGSDPRATDGEIFHPPKPVIMKKVKKHIFEEGIPPIPERLFQSNDNNIT